MFWLFASVVLILIVLHRGFRKVAFWLGGAAAVVAAIALGVTLWNQKHEQRQSAAAFLDSVQCAYGPKLPNGDCPSAPANGTGEVYVPAGFTLDCPAGQRPAKDNITGKQSCYNPHDAAQLAEHLEACNPKHDPYAGIGTIVADRRNIPCNEFDKYDNDCPAPPAAPWPGCVSHDSEPWTKYPKIANTHEVKDPAILTKLNSAPPCPPGQQAVALNVNAPWSCYDPKDPAQVAQHLKECKPSEPYQFVPDTDKRGVSCSKQ
jgi:hypothetical protein